MASTLAPSLAPSSSPNAAAGRARAASSSSARGRVAVVARGGSGAASASDDRKEELARMRASVQLASMNPSQETVVSAILDLSRQEFGLVGVKFAEIMAKVGECYRFDATASYVRRVLLAAALVPHYYDPVRAAGAARAVPSRGLYRTHRRISPPITPRFRSRHTAAPLNSASDAFKRHPAVALNDGRSTLSGKGTDLETSNPPGVNVGSLKVRSVHWSPYDPVGVVNAVP
jgi:hypothetical protein